MTLMSSASTHIKQHLSASFSCTHRMWREAEIWNRYSKQTWTRSNVTFAEKARRTRKTTFRPEQCGRHRLFIADEVIFCFRPSTSSNCWPINKMLAALVNWIRLRNENLWFITQWHKQRKKQKKTTEKTRNRTRNPHAIASNKPRNTAIRINN